MLVHCPLAVQPSSGSLVTVTEKAQTFLKPFDDLLAGFNDVLENHARLHEDAF